MPPTQIMEHLKVKFIKEKVQVHEMSNLSKNFIEWITTDHAMEQRDKKILEEMRITDSEDIFERSYSDDYQEARL